MLERTAGCLESGTLRRLLPASKKSTKSRRALHSGFWTHGATDLELSPLWAALVRASDQVDAQVQEKKPRVQNAMLLDFLYPAGTLNFLRSYSGWWADRQDGRFGRAGFGRIGHRQYTSSATETLKETAPESDHRIRATNGDPRDMGRRTQDLLYEMLELKKPYDYEEAWRQFMLQDGNGQDQVRPALIYYLRGSDRIVDAERTTELYDVLEETEKDAGSHRWAIRAYLKLRNLSEAMQLYASGLEKLCVPAGSEEILAHLINSSSWARAMSLWKESQGSRNNPTASYDIFSVIKTLPNLSTVAKHLADFADSRIELASSEPSTTQDLRTFTYEIIRRAVTRREGFDSANFTTLLRFLQKWRMDSKKLYSEVFDMLIELKETKLAVKCYRHARQAEHVEFTQSTLNSVLKIFCDNHSVIGMKQVLDDAFKMNGAPNQHAYRICMREFAFQGDAQTVHALFDQYIARFSKLEKDGMRVISANDMAPILQVHTKRGEIDDVIKWFSRIESEYDLKPTLLCWNILLNAYGKVHDFERAFATFDKILRDPSLKPDDYTFGTILGICTTRGDTNVALQIYKSAKKYTTPSMAMIDAIVQCHCQDDELKRAEELCEEALKMKFQGRRTRMWNSVLNAYAMRHDILNVNRVLQRMSGAKVDYDQYTYSALIQALCMVRQPYRAFSILTNVMPEAGIAATHFHYAIVMGGFIAIGDLQKVFQIHKRLTRRGVPPSASTDLMLMKGLVQEEQESQNKQGHEVTLQQALDMFQTVMGSRDAQEISSNTLKGTQRQPVDIAYPTMFFGYIIFVLGQNRQFKTVDALYDAYKAILPASRQGKPPPNITSALMAAKLREGEHDIVRDCWVLALAEAKEAGKPLPETSIMPIMSSDNDTSSQTKALKLVQRERASTTWGDNILPVHQMALRKHLHFYMQSLFAQGKGEELIKTVENYQADGFQLDVNNWNHYIELLSKFKVKLAFELCESKLMPGWTGWARVRRTRPERNRLPLELRRLRKQANHLRPKTGTLLWLAKAYLNIESQSSEDSRAEVMIDWLLSECPKTMDAIQTMQRTDDFVERRILHN